MERYQRGGRARDQWLESPQVDDLGLAIDLVVIGPEAPLVAGVAESKRIPFAKLAPGDVLFFGPNGSRSQSSSIGHTGIYLGGGWMIHSSGQGVAVSPLTGWYRQQFAWGRRPLAEAGLTT